MVKRKRKVWDKVNLLETSAVGLPSYPDAHLSYESKTLTTDNLIGNTELNLNPKEPMAEEEQPIVETEETPVEEPVEEAEVTETEEETEEAEEVAEAEEEKSEPEEETPDVKSIVKDAICEALKELNEQRAMVEKSEVEKATLAKKSIGELAIDSGLFK